MRRGYATVAVCLVLVLSGCSFLPGGATDDADGPPGVEGDELVDADALLDAHADRLTESGYGHDVTVNRTGVRDDVTVETVTRQRMRVAAGATQYERQTIYEGQGRVVAWGNESVEFQRIETGGSEEYSRASPESARAMAGVNILEPHLSAPYEVVDEGSVEGRTLFTLEATGEPTDEDAFTSGTTTVERYESRLVVDEAGRIYRLDVSAEYQESGDPGEYEVTYELTSSTDPGVERPSWVDAIDE